MTDGTAGGTRGPLAGIVVCELATVLAGPFCGQLLGDLGADVVKVEPPGGDPTRGWGPPFAAARGSAPGGRGESAYFLSINRNKRSVRLDLHTPAHRELLVRLLARSDVLVENFRPGGLERLGLDENLVAAVNPRLVHLSITGYGREGPLADRPGFDFIIQAMSGLMSITGMPDDAGGQPTKVGVAVSDLTAGMLGAIAVLAALHTRDAAGQDGRGQRIDLSLLGSTMSWLANQAGNYLVGGVVPRRLGNAHPNITPYETFATADGALVVAVGSEAQWQRFCQAVGRRELADDATFATNASRVDHRVELRGALEPVFAQAPTDEWLARFADAEVPAGPINDLAAAYADPQVAVAAAPVETEHPTAGRLRLPGFPFALRETPLSVRRPPPLLGEHTDEILEWLAATAG